MLRVVPYLSKSAAHYLAKLPGMLPQFDSLSQWKRTPRKPALCADGPQQAQICLLLAPVNTVRHLLSWGIVAISKCHLRSQHNTCPHPLQKLHQLRQCSGWIGWLWVADWLVWLNPKRNHPLQRLHKLRQCGGWIGCLWVAGWLVLAQPET